MIQIAITLLALKLSAPIMDIPKILNSPQPTVEHMIGKAFKPKRDPGYFFTPKGLDRVRINGFGSEMNAVLVNFSAPLTPDQALRALGLDPAKASMKSEPSPTNVPVHLTRNKVQIRIMGLRPNSKSHKSWVIEYEQDAVANTSRTVSLKSQIESASGPEKMRLIQSCYDWRATVMLDSR